MSSACLLCLFHSTSSWSILQPPAREDLTVTPSPTKKKSVPSCEADVWKAENPPQFPSTAQPRGQSWCWWLPILGEVSSWESHLAEEPFYSHVPGPLRAAQPQPLPCAPLAAGSGTGELSLTWGSSRPLLSGLPAGSTRGQCGFGAATSAFCCFPQPSLRQASGYSFPGLS